ncbi:MAG: cyclic-guanylate-specific phosphodiesterase [Rhizobium sp.]|nr:cyclic-guanylate-specific phosphodiesterase [Rhizobium sp.]
MLGFLIFPVLPVFFYITNILNSHTIGMMLDLMPMGLLIHTQQGIIFGNQEASRLLQIPQDQIVGRHFLDFLQTQVDEAAQQMELAFEGSISANSTEAEIRTAEGTVRTIKLIAGALPWDGNPVVQLLLQDITDLKAIQDALHRLTITDELTGVFNRRYAVSIANKLFHAAQTESRPFSVAIFDIDHFKGSVATFPKVCDRTQIHR